MCKVLVLESHHSSSALLNFEVVFQIFCDTLTVVECHVVVLGLFQRDDDKRDDSAANQCA